jgi:hypothetical protein
MSGSGPSHDAPSPSKPRVAAPKVYGAKSPPASSDPSPLLAGIIAGLAAGFLWAVVAYLTHYAWSWGAWAVGALVGLAVRRAARASSASLATTAAALAAGALVFGKLLIHVFAMQPIIEAEMLQNQQAVNVAYFVDMTERRAFSPPLKSEIADVPDLLKDSVPVAVRRRMYEEALDSARGAPLAERRLVVHRAVKQVAALLVKEVGNTKLFRAEFDRWDLLWFALAVSTAWRLAMRTSTTERMRTAEEDQAARREADRKMRQEQVRRTREQAEPDQRPPTQ